MRKWQFCAKLIEIHLAIPRGRLYNGSMNPACKGVTIKMIAKIIRAVSGLLLIFQCAVLIAFFGILPLVGFAACPVQGTNADSIYKDGSLAFVREVPADKLNKGDIAFYYKGRTAVGSRVTANDASASRITVRTKNGTASIPYQKITGRGTPFSVPMLGKYADWLTAGKGLLYSVIAMGAMFVVFGISAFCVRDRE